MCLSGPADDYEPVSEDLTLMPGLDSRNCTNVIIDSDEIDEVDEEFTIDLTLFSPWPTFRNTTSVVILDDGEYSSPSKT